MHCHSHFDSKIFNYQHENFKCDNVRRLLNKEVLLSKNEEKIGERPAGLKPWTEPATGRQAGPVLAMVCTETVKKSRASLL